MHPPKADDFETMGIECSLRAISPAELAALEADEDRAEEFFCPIDLAIADPAQLELQREREQAEGRLLLLDKGWHILHVALTGDAGFEYRRVPGPLGAAIQGGADTRFEATYGFVRRLEPAEVCEIASALRQLPLDALIERIDMTTFTTRDVYPPSTPTWPRSDIEHVVRSTFPALVAFYSRAADRGDVVLISND